MTSLVERHAAKIVGTLSCYDRVIIQGTLPGVGYAAGMTGYLKARDVRLFDFAEFTKPLTQAIRENVQRIASQHGLEVEDIRSAKLLRKEDQIAEVLAKRGNHPGLVHIFSAMETCSTFAPWHDKKTGKTSLRRDSGKCIHYYFPFLDPELGLCYVRVPTWAPFRLQVLQRAQLACSSPGRARLPVHPRRQRLSFRRRLRRSPEALGRLRR